MAPPLGPSKQKKRGRDDTLDPALIELSSDTIPPPSRRKKQKAQSSSPSDKKLPASASGREKVQASISKKKQTARARSSKNKATKRTREVNDHSDGNDGNQASDMEDAQLVGPQSKAKRHKAKAKVAGVAERGKKAKAKAGRKKKKADVSSAETILKHIDFRKATIVKRSAASVIRKEWIGVLDDTVKRLCRLSCLASRFLNFYISLIFDAEERHCIPFGPTASVSAFDDTFFEHIYKVLLHDTKVQQFEPTLGFARCMFFNKLLVKHEEAEPLTPHEIASLWTELVNLHTASVEYKKAASQVKKAKEDKSNNVGGVDDDDEQSDGAPPEKKVFDTPITDSITGNVALKNLLPSCANLDQCIKYERTSFKTSFDRHQHSGLRAHVGWYLVAKYQLKKKAARRWLEQYYPEKEELLDSDAATSNESLTVEQQAEKDARRALSIAETKDEELNAGDNVEEENDDVDAEEMDTRQIWSSASHAFEHCRLKSLDSTNMTERVRLHYSIQREMDSMGKNSISLDHCLDEDAMEIDEDEEEEEEEEERKESDKRPVSQTSEKVTINKSSLCKFSLAPLVGFSRAFKLFDLKTLQDQCRHPLFNTAGKVRPVLHTVVDIFHEDGNMLGLCPKEATNPSAIRCDFHERSIRTFRFDGVQIHLMWEKIVSIPCKVDAKRAAKYEEDKQKRLATQKRKPDGTLLDGRCKPKPPRFLSGSDGAVFRPADARLEDYTCGVFQSKSILASRKAALEKGISLRTLFPRIVSGDPGHSNILSCAIYNHQRHDWDRGPNLSKKHFYHKLDPMRNRLSRRKRIEFRLKHSKGLAARVKHHQEQLSLHSIKSSRPDDCMANLLLVRSCWDDMFAFYGSKSAAREQFSSEQKRRSLIDRFIQEIAPEHLKHDTIIVLGAAKFATSFKGTQSSPIGMLVKEIAKVRRVVLMDEYDTTAMCSGCNLHGVGRFEDDIGLFVPPFDKNAPANNKGSELHPLRPKSCLQVVPVSLKTKRKPHQLQHPTAPMVSFRRTVEPKRQKTRRLKNEMKWGANPLPPKPPDPGIMKKNKKTRCPLSGRIHGLKQCSRQSHIIHILT